MYAMIAQRSRGRHAIAVRIHRAEAVGDHAEEVSHGRVCAAGRRETKAAAESALHDHAVAVAGQSVARRAENVEALAAAIQHGARDREWKRVRRRWPFSIPGEQHFAPARDDFAARHGSRDRRALRLAVGEKIARVVRVVARLHVHIEAAAGAAAEPRTAASRQACRSRRARNAR